MDRDRSGVVAILFALVLPVVVGFLGLGVEVGTWYESRRSLQTAADAAALGAAYNKAAGGTAAQMRAVALREAQRNGWNPATGTLSVNNPPTSGSLAGTASAVEVVLTEESERTLSGLLAGTGTVTIDARSVTNLGGTSGLGAASACVVALDPSAYDALHLYNNAVVSNKDCGLISNSSSSAGIHLDNNATAAGPVSVVGSWLLQNGASLTNASKTKGAAAVADPYAGISVPAKPSCTSGQTWQQTNMGTVNLTPGRFCQGWNYANNVTVNLAPGVYYLDQAVNIQNNVTINGTGVTLVLGGNFNVNIGNNAYLNLGAPTSGALQGIAMTTYPGATAGIVQNFANNSFLNLDGALYFPNQDVTLQNNATTNNNHCSQIVARRVNLTNNVVLGSKACGGAGIKGAFPGAQSVTLAE